MQDRKTIHNEQYAELIKILVFERKRLGLSQVEVANALGMSQSDISKVETLERRIDILEFKAILEAYRCTDNLSLRRKIIDFLGLEE